MNLHTKISVITPSYNQGQFLEQTINSVLDQNYPNLELIIIDGGSTDNSVEIIKKYDEKIDYWVSEPDNGQSHAFNKGLKSATGEIIGWLNSDDLYINDCLFRAEEFFQTNSLVDVVFSDYYFIDENNKTIKRRKEIPFNYSIYLWTGDCYHANCAGFFRQKVFKNIGGLDENLHFGMDYEFYLRCAKAGYNFGHYRDFWGKYRLHGKSKSVSKFGQMKNEAIQILSKYRPPNESLISIILKHYYYKILRILKKIIIGSYPTTTVRILRNR